MKRCPNCGNLETETSKFCSVCGSKMEGAVRQNPFRQEDDPTVLLDAEELRNASQTSGGNPRAYTEAERSNYAANGTQRQRGSAAKARSSTKYIVLVVVLIVALIVAGCFVFVSRMLSSGSNEGSTVQSGSVIQSESDLNDIFESETPEVSESTPVESETTPAETEAETVTESAAVESEEVSESPSESPEEEEAESESPSPSPSESVSPSPSESASTGKTYDGITITTDYVIANSSSAYLTESDLTGLNA